MTDKSGQTRQGTNNLGDELIWDELCQLTKVGVSFRQYNNIAATDVFNKNENVAIINVLILFILISCGYLYI